MKRELSGKVNRELSGKTLKDLSDDEIVEVIVDTVKEQTRALRFNESFVSNATSINFPRDVVDIENKAIGHVEKINYDPKNGYSMTVVITDEEMIKKITGGNECQSIRLSSKMKTDKS